MITAYTIGPARLNDFETKSTLIWIEIFSWFWSTTIIGLQLTQMLQLSKNCLQPINTDVVVRRLLDKNRSLLQRRVCYHIRMPNRINPKIVLKPTVKFPCHSSCSDVDATSYLVSTRTLRISTRQTSECITIGGTCIYIYGRPSPKDQRIFILLEAK